MKAFAAFAVALLVLVAFSPTAGPEDAALPDGADPFEEQIRRLTVAGGPSRMPRLAWSDDALHVAWVDGRGGSAGVYHKASTDEGETFPGDRPLATGFAAIDAPSLAASSRVVGVAWAGRLPPGTEPDVYVQASAGGAIVALIYGIMGFILDVLGALFDPPVEIGGLVALATAFGLSMVAIGISAAVLSAC